MWLVKFSKFERIYENLRRQWSLISYQHQVWSDVKIVFRFYRFIVSQFLYDFKFDNFFPCGVLIFLRKFISRMI